MRAEYVVMVRACSQLALQAFQLLAYVDDIAEMQANDLTEEEEAAIKSVADDIHKQCGLLVLKLDQLSTKEDFK